MRTRRGRARPGVLGWLAWRGWPAVAVVLIAGCGPGQAGHAGQPGAVGGPAAARPGGSAQAAAASFCVARPSTTLTAALGSVVPGSLRREIVPLGVAANGATAYVSAWTPGYAGVAALSLRTGALRPIARFGDPASDQADGAWGGRWLVWAQTYSLTSLDNFTVFGWDSVTGRVTRLGHSLSAPGRAPWPSPWHAPAVSGHFAAWAQGYGPGGLVQIRLADLDTGRVTVIARGHVQAPFFDGGLLVWPASGRPGALTRLHAYATATGRPAALPVVLRGVRGTDFVAADGRRTAYLDPGLHALYYSPAPEVTASVVLRLPPGVSFSGLGMARGALAWTTTRATYLASTGSGRYVQVTPAFGFAVTGTGPNVLVADAPAVKAAHPALALHVLDAAGIGPGSC